MRKFVDDFVAEGDTLLERTARGEAINITM
jgi:hypothetical protein